MERTLANKIIKCSFLSKEFFINKIGYRVLRVFFEDGAYGSIIGSKFSEDDLNGHPVWRYYINSHKITLFNSQHKSSVLFDKNRHHYVLNCVLENQ
jgi:hypothetical protein